MLDPLIDRKDRDVARVRQAAGVEQPLQAAKYARRPVRGREDSIDEVGTGQVLTWEGEGHTAYPNTPCITKAVDDYLIGLTVPQVGLRCPAR